MDSTKPTPKRPVMKLKQVKQLPKVKPLTVQY